MTTELRVLRPAEWAQWFEQLELAFGGLPENPQRREVWEAITEHERSIGLWDGERCVGTAGAFSFRMCVPGGALVPAAGVTMVSVAATHRRRSLLTSMMRRQLDDVRSWGESVAVLTASEPGIYGRYGYGIATQQLRAAIDTARVRLAVPPGTDGVVVRQVAPPEALATIEGLYARLVPTRPGMLERRPEWERLTVIDPPEERDGGSPLQCVLAERDGEAVGYALYTIKPAWDDAGPKGTVAVRDLGALDPAADGALWRFLCGIDLTSTVEVGNRPVDDAWQHMVSDIRRCRPQLRDSLHVRLVDVGAALEARTYQAPVDVVLEVEDDFCPWNAGRWRLTGDAKGAVCVRTDEAADLALTVRELGAAYLGGVSPAALAAAGRVRELRAGALGEAAVAFGSPVAPWLPHGF
ncbi:GNAT family N-acetyltransferase [Streptomyces purpureus]|uniref:GNAT family N-acetyltransferase n=1 Tax=Streptomyces purpureus TaxID=1951 RepID=UPI0003708B21|nr:GNAT family N-acetyltransferase [Streptomyces purpureus]